MKKILLLMSVAVLAISCDRSETDIPGLTTYKDMVINNNATLLEKRVAFTNEPVVYNFSDILSTESKGDQSPSVSISVIGEMTPPQYNNEVLQASHVRIVDGYAYLAYNTQGPRYLGGADIVCVASPSRPKLISSVVFINSETNKGKDISSIDVEPKGSGNNNCVWLAAADESNDQLATPAVVERYILNASNQFEHSDDPVQYYDLPGYVGTDVRFFNNRVYVTSGTGGGLTILNNGMNQAGFIELSNARSVDVNANNVLALGGNPGSLLSPDRFYETVGGATDPEAKSIVRLYNNFALVALGEEGLKCYDLSSSTPTTAVSSLPRPAVPEGANEAEYVTNAVSVYKGWVFIANGAAGLDVAKLDSYGNLKWMGNIDLGASVNFVEASCNNAFVATGTGGLKILKITVL